MGSFDCYCAICGGSLTGAQIGSRKSKHYFVRKQLVQKNRAAIIAGETDGLEAMSGIEANDNKEEIESEEGGAGDEGGGGEEEEEEGGGGEEVGADEVGTGEDSDAASEDEEEEEEDEDEEEEEDEEDVEDEDKEGWYMRYDPDLVSRASTAWLKKVFGLVFDPNKPGSSQTFIDGPGMYNDYGGFDIHHGDRSYPCYDDEESTVFPFHRCCYIILGKAITGRLENSLKKVTLNQDVLYSVMANRTPEYGRRLALDYGDISGCDQYWDSIAGEEYSVAHPTVIPGLEGFLRKELSKESFKISHPAKPMILHEKVVKDPFRGLPFDILHNILIYLPGHSIRAFRKASWFVHDSTRFNSFWKRLIMKEMSWFWELHELINEPWASELDLKKLFIWIDKKTTLDYGMEGLFMGVVNRRRIWGVCEQLALLYSSWLHGKEASEASEHATSILKYSNTLQMPLVSHPLPADPPWSVSKQWIYSWEETDNFLGVFNTFWNEKGILVGLGVAFGSSQRNFGRDDTDRAERQIIHKHTARIFPSDWIQGLLLNISDCRNQTDEDGAFVGSVAITGLTILFRSGKQTMIRHRDGNTRPLIASHGSYLTGVTGQISGDSILRLGILECVRPQGDNFDIYATDPSLASPARRETTELLIARNSFWHPTANQIICQDNKRGFSIRVAEIFPKIYLLANPHAEDDVSDDLVPKQVLLWAKEPKEFDKLTQISALVSQDMRKTAHPDGTTAEVPFETIIGLRTQYIRKYWEPKRYVGFTRDEDVHEQRMHHCDIDGPGGEYITSVEVAVDQWARAIRVSKGHD
ncbi:hypothetical protein AJ80_00960 [Polytolypa hystricis UAMH7299]|uniref:Uncharacterized protein n=1 Tax=Polytolypa hystricis (strain UAMH7299) TaxID=1447883 RepID=A0A2B7Z1G9_POLH7|nr:hypothetical protein AJ80_00960 [Polytolypa hystricis UAMH7299]